MIKSFFKIYVFDVYYFYRICEFYVYIFLMKEMNLFIKSFVTTHMANTISEILQLNCMCGYWLSWREATGGNWSLMQLLSSSSHRGLSIIGRTIEQTSLSPT